ncbi:MAG: hypothetical protein ACXVAY_01415 [Mucilaginibacter sp.]
MKSIHKSFLLATLFLFAVSAILSAKAQVKIFQSDQTIHAAGVDTVSGTGSVSQLLKITGKFDVTVQTGVTKLTGTPGGTVKLLGSVDGVKFDYVNITPDSLIIVNKAPLQVKTWRIVGNPYQVYKCVFTGSGTHTSKITTTALVR